MSGINSAFTVTHETRDWERIAQVHTFTNRILAGTALLSLPTSIFLYFLWLKFNSEDVTVLQLLVMFLFTITTALDGLFLKNLSLSIAINHHLDLSIKFLIANFVSIFFLSIFLPLIGIVAYPIAFLIVDLVMIPAANRKSDIKH